MADVVFRWCWCFWLMPFFVFYLINHTQIMWINHTQIMWMFSWCRFSLIYLKNHIKTKFKLILKILFQKRNFLFFEGSIPGGCVFVFIIYFFSKQKTQNDISQKHQNKRKTTLAKKMLVFLADVIFRFLGVFLADVVFRFSI